MLATQPRIALGPSRLTEGGISSPGRLASRAPAWSGKAMPRGTYGALFGGAEALLAHDVPRHGRRSGESPSGSRETGSCTVRGRQPPHAISRFTRSPGIPRVRSTLSIVTSALASPASTSRKVVITAANLGPGRGCERRIRVVTWPSYERTSVIGPAPCTEPVTSSLFPRQPRNTTRTTVGLSSGMLDAANASLGDCERWPSSTACCRRARPSPRI